MNLFDERFASPVRARLFEPLAVFWFLPFVLRKQGVRTVEELSDRAHLTFANTSRHLQILRRARLVETERPANTFSIAWLAMPKWSH
jgi:hypothetical protein